MLTASQTSPPEYKCPNFLYLAGKDCQHIAFRGTTVECCPQVLGAGVSARLEDDQGPYPMDTTSIATWAHWQDPPAIAISAALDSNSLAVNIPSDR